MFFTPFSFVGSFRTFYFLLAIYNLLCLVQPPRYQRNSLNLLLGIGLLCLFSASLSLFSQLEAMESLAANPLLRTLIIINLMLGFYFLSLEFGQKQNGSRVLQALHWSYYGFIAVFSLGLALYIARVTGKIPLSLYSRFVSLYQEGYGYLRLSPGTYPNEFGILCSFYALYALSIFGANRRLGHLLMFMAFFAGMLLTSTRAAYITFVAGFGWMLWCFPLRAARVQYLAIMSLTIPAMMALLVSLSIDVVSIVENGVNALFKSSGGSVGVRVTDWKNAMEDFQDNLWFGAGFESPLAAMLHNVPLQFAYGLGFLPLTLLILMALAFFYYNRHHDLQVVQFSNPLEMKLLSLIRLLLLGHVIVFALTNHNQTHFFPWVCFMLYCLHYQYRPSLQSKPVSA